MFFCLHDNILISYAFENELLFKIIFIMKRKQFLALILIVAGIFTLLFYRNSIGINLTIFEWVLIPVMLFVNKPDKLNFLSKSMNNKIVDN